MCERGGQCVTEESMKERKKMRERGRECVKEEESVVCDKGRESVCVREEGSVV